MCFCFDWNILPEIICVILSENAVNGICSKCCGCQCVIVRSAQFTLLSAIICRLINLIMKKTFVMEMFIFGDKIGSFGD
jgi:uncharacterized Fe-S cluster-containing radical SAM superfamily protein